MTCDQAHLWKAMIYEDLVTARRSLVAPSGASDRYLRHRIAEDEAILERLAAIDSTAHEPDVRAVGRPI